MYTRISYLHASSQTAHICYILLHLHRDNIVNPNWRRYSQNHNAQRTMGKNPNYPHLNVGNGSQSAEKKRKSDHDLWQHKLCCHYRSSTMSKGKPERCSRRCLSFLVNFFAGLISVITFPGASQAKQSNVDCRGSKFQSSSQILVPEERICGWSGVECFVARFVVVAISATVAQEPAV